jgi:exodeoxyribonuclease VII small subunit
MAEKKKLTYSYSQAIGELEKIIHEIEAESVDVDVLAEKVKRATYLIKFCKSNLRTTEEEVKKVLSDIEERPETELPSDIGL